MNEGPRPVTSAVFGLARRASSSSPTSCSRCRATSSLEKFGARKWIARIMIKLGRPLRLPWPSCRANGHQLLRRPLPARHRRSRVLPRHHLLLTLWFPAAYRARIIGYFMAAIPLSSVLGARPSPAPCSTWTAWAACTAGSGCSSWRPSPPSFSPSVVLVYLTGRPGRRQAWLTGRENATWLHEHAWPPRSRSATASRTTRSPSASARCSTGRVIALGFVYIGASPSPACTASASSCRRSSVNSASPPSRTRSSPPSRSSSASSRRWSGAGSPTGPAIARASLPSRCS